jgi:hypothetical protein
MWWTRLFVGLALVDIFAFNVTFFIIVERKTWLVVTRQTFWADERAFGVFAFFIDFFAVVGAQSALIYIDAFVSVIYESVLAFTFYFPPTLNAFLIYTARIVMITTQYH